MSERTQDGGFGTEDKISRLLAQFGKHALAGDSIRVYTGIEEATGELNPGATSFFRSVSPWREMIASGWLKIDVHNGERRATLTEAGAIEARRHNTESPDR